MPLFLPTTVKEVETLDWDYIDVILFSGDAYVDHPSFGPSVIGRILEAAGYRVAIVPQPNWRDDLRDFRKLGVPRLFFGVSAGNMDSMVNHYTANKRMRSDDAYTPGGKAGFRPDYAATVYTRILKSLYPHIPVVIGGIEASLRRLTHYDYWQDKLKPSILAESGADILLYGMADKTVTEVAKTLKNGFNANLLRKIPQTGFIADDSYVSKLPQNDIIKLRSYEDCLADPKAFMDNFVVTETESNRMEPGKALIEKTSDKWIVINPPYPLMTTEEIDRSYDLPYTRMPHPRYKGKGTIPAYEMIKHSVNIHRGCFGGCSFCTISAHQGKYISSRSEKSVMREVEKIAGTEGFKGYISDVGGPSANMYGMAGRDIGICRKCARPSCLFPKVCKNLDNDHSRLLKLYREIRMTKGVKKAFIGSGIRYDLFDGGEYLREVVVHHTSGRLKVAPEHTEDNVVGLMRKPPFTLFRKLNEDFARICRENGLKYQLIPYFISSHPGCGEQEMQKLANITRPLDFRLEQVQDFTPTPMTLSSVMFHTGVDPYTGKKLYVARNQDDKRRQKSYFFDASRNERREQGGGKANLSVTRSNPCAQGGKRAGKRQDTGTMTPRFSKRKNGNKRT